jgi:hypothetical protein
MFRNGDRTDICIENLELVSRAELLRLNQHGYKDMPDELKPSVLGLAKLETVVFSRKKEISI